MSALAASAAQAAARLIDLSRARRLVYVGGDGSLLAAFLQAWPQLGGVWFGPEEGHAAATAFLARHGLDARVRYVDGDSLDTIAAGELVVLSAVDTAVDHSLQLLASAGPQWLPAAGRWLILRRESPHLSSIVDLPLLQQLGLRVASRWSLCAGVQMLVCTPAHRFLELLDHGNRAAAPAPVLRPGGLQRARWRSPALVATVLGLLATLAAAWAGLLMARAAAPPPAVAAAPAMPAIPAMATAQFTHRALNALLVPLLDDAQPLRWTDVALQFFCGPDTRVEVDGRPLAPGTALPARAFSVHWHIDHCWPLDFAAFELSGDVTLLAFHDDDSLGAIVDARALRIATARGTGHVDTPFAATMALGGDTPVQAR